MAEVKKKKRPAYKGEQRTGEVSAVQEAFGELEGLGEEMRETEGNMADTLSATEKYQTASDAADNLEGIRAVEPPDAVSGLAITYIELVNTRKGRGPSRATRLDNAVNILRAAEDACNEWLDDDANADHAERDDVQQFADDLGSAADEADGIEFPGMFG